MFRRLVLYNKNFCVDIAKKTFPFYTNLNDIFIKYFNNVGMLAKCYSEHGSVNQKIFDFDQNSDFDFIQQSASLYLSECRESIEKNDFELIFINCLNYCHRFDMWNFEGILPNVVQMGKIFELISTRLIEAPEIQVTEPSEKIRQFKFPFTDFSMNIFENFDFMFGETGIDIANLAETND